LISPVLLLHGQPGSVRDWDGVVGRLGHRRFVAFDRPGWDGVRAATHLDGNARAAVTELDLHGIDRAVVVGHSFGGAVAARLATQHAERVAGLVLLAPSANLASLQAIDRLLAAPLAGPILSGLMFGLGGWALSLGRLRQTLPGDNDYLRAAGRRLRSPAAWRAFVVEQRALVADLPVLEPTLGRIAAPTRILAGSSDRVVPLTSLRQLATQIPGARLQLVDGEGHLLPLRRPAAVVRAIESLELG
jgi:pimeloyl-ACP methyl ester carboxylesterase